MERVTGEYRDGLIAGFRREALHLEMRDAYAAADHGRYRSWLVGEPPDPAQEAEWWRPWREAIGAHQSAGRTLRRLRIVSEPVTHYIWFGWLAVDPALVGRCAAAFEEAWAAALPRGESRPRR